MNSYRYFLIYDRNKQVIYGECINWRCGEFDSIKESDITIDLKKQFKARFIVSSIRIDSVDDDRKCININGGATLWYEEDYDDFITQRSDEVVFSPLIDRCSKIKMFVGSEMTSYKYQSWANEHKQLLEQVKTKFDLDLLNRPELLNSYTYYEPTRIVVNSKFVDKPLKGENRLPQILQVKFFDEFNAYAQAKYVITGYCEDKDPQIKDGIISEKETLINFSNSPDEIEIEIIDQGETIFNSRHGFIRNINIRGRVIGDSVTLDNGSKVSKYNELNMNVGKE